MSARDGMGHDGTERGGTGERGWGGWGVESDGMGVHVTGRDRAGLDRKRPGLASWGGRGATWVERDEV